jgi:hypothetical protein
MGQDKVLCEETLNLVVIVFCKTGAANLFDMFIPIGARNRFSESCHLVTLGCDQSRDVTGESFTGSIYKKPCDKKTNVTCVKNSNNQ